MGSDFIDDISQRAEEILAVHGLDREIISQCLELWCIEVRREYGGERHYVAVLGTHDRNQQIIIEWSRRRQEKGIRQKLATKYQLDRSTISRLITKHLKQIQKFCVGPSSARSFEGRIAAAFMRFFSSIRGSQVLSFN
ncbi:MAG: hypothetical protein KUF80_06330 [Candidatus Thiodiazotropha sp. (ex Codakia orbicularis)]|nr:hypothetical protein [Candidatus Thiodiazotropha sp. (ex Codakia orbicularis)]